MWSFISAGQTLSRPNRQMHQKTAAVRRGSGRGLKEMTQVFPRGQMFFLCRGVCAEECVPTPKKEAGMSVRDS